MFFIVLKVIVCNDMIMNDQYYTPKELAKMLKCNSRTIVTLINQGKLKAINVGTKERAHWRIFEGQYLKFLADSYEKII